MPVGFENTALKMSFSLSSLQSQGTPPQVMMEVERPYHSLSKKTKSNVEREMLRRSWGTPEEKKDDFWNALLPNYNYLMASNLIDSCKEVQLSCREEKGSVCSKWNDFTEHFIVLRDWLDKIQEAVYGKEENIRDRKLREEHVEEMQRNDNERSVFNENANRLLLEHPELKEDVSWRVNYLNKRWLMTEQLISPSKKSHTNVSHEAACLKDWIREMERRLKLLNVHDLDKNSNEELSEKITECAVLHQDISAHSKVVLTVRKRAEREEVAASLKLAMYLEKRFHHLFLLSLEWQVRLEDLLKGRQRDPKQMCYESDEEPLSKHPRLSSADCSDHLTDDGSYFEDDIKDFCVEDLASKNATDSSVVMCSQQCVKSGSIDELHQNRNSSVEDAESMSHKSAVSCQTSNKNAEMQTNTSSTETDAIPFNQSDRKAHNLATYYFKHDDRKDWIGNIRGENTGNKGCDEKMCDDSSDDEWTYTSGCKATIVKDHVESFAEPHISTFENHRQNVCVRLDFGQSNGEALNNEKQDSLKLCNAEGNSFSLETNSSCSEILPLPQSTTNTKELQRLVRQAEMLVREDVVPSSEGFVNPSGQNFNSQARHTRIKQWVTTHSALQNKFQIPDSCDASGEYTTGDSEEECGSLALQGESTGICLLNKDVDVLLSSTQKLESTEDVDLDATLKADNKNLIKSNEQSKVVSRVKQQCKRDRPWSVSGISQLSSLANKEEFVYACYSTSALHEMVSPSNIIRDRQNSTISSNSFQDNLSSSTVNETIRVASEHSSSLPRRRRQRKKTSQSTGCKSDSTLGAMNQLSCNVEKCAKFKNIVNNQSMEPALADDKDILFSETTGVSTSEQNTVSDSSVFPTESSSSKANDDDKTVESEEELFLRRNVGFPNFRLGPNEGAVTLKPDLLTRTLLRNEADSDVACPLPGTEEQLSSSDQAWDNYQEKYMSEPYSEEIADSDMARRLLEFGDDYHNFLNSQSDCASSIDTNQRASPQRKRKSIVGAGECSALDSDSDLEDINHVICESQSHFAFTEQFLNKHPCPEMWVRDYAEFIATCKENKRCLKVILENVKETEILTVKERREVVELLGKWSNLQNYADELQKMSRMQTQLVILRKKLLGTKTKISFLANNLTDMTQLQSAIGVLKEESSSLLDFKEQLLNLDDAVHQLETGCTSEHSSLSSFLPQLKEDVKDLYKKWNKTFQSVASRLEQFERAVEMWNKFDKESSSLQTTLQGDRSTLVGLGKSLDDGAVAVDDIAVSIRDIARLLSEFPDTSNRNFHSRSSSCQELQESSLGTREGSYSDSGISDSGSENEMSERARRIAFLRQLANHLQTELGTSECLVSQINEQIEFLDRELHQLQDVCKNLMVRTTKNVIPEEIPLRGLISTKTIELHRPTNSSNPLITGWRNGQGVEECSKAVYRSPAGLQSNFLNCEKSASCSKEKNVKKEERHPWVWRVARAALPLQLALAAVVCVACFLQPHCCESVNNLNSPLSPQLRYLYGPPPV